MHNIIKKLADMISSNNIEQIERHLRVAAVSLRNSNQAHLHTEIEKDKKILLLAHAFLTRRGKPNDNWRTSQICFEQLTDWFLQATDIDNHLQLSMASWCCQLEQTLKNSINPTSLISLGSAYYAEPHKFMGFLYWLLENGTNHESIMRPTLLHRFFAYHAHELDTVKKSYALLANLSDNVNRLLSLLKKESCNMRGYINNKRDENNENESAYYSYNLLGSFFSHEEELPLNNIREAHNLCFESTSLECAEQLFYLFGWELIKKLDFSYGNEISQQLLQNLLRSQTRTKILSEIPSGALDGQFSTPFTTTILSIIGETYIPADLLEITLSEPFYIHAVKLDLYPIFEPHLGNIIHLLCHNEKYLTLHHLPFLAFLAHGLANDTAINPFRANWNTVEINLLLKSIVDIILPHGNSIYDDAIQPINYIFSRLKPFFLEKMAQFANNIDTAIHNYNDGEIDYETVTHTWGSQLSTCNLIFSLLPNLARETSYPRIIYQLHARVLQKKCDLCIAKNEMLSLENILSVMIPDASKQKRILQETLIDPLSQAALIEAILNYRTSLFSSDSLISEPFGNIKSVLFHACTTKAGKLQTVLFNKISIENHIFSIIENTLFENHIREFDIAWSYIEFNAPNKIEMIRMLLRRFQHEIIDAEIRLNYFDKLFFLINTSQEIKLPDGTLKAVLAEMIKYGAVSRTKTLCNLNGINQLTRNDIESALFDDAIEWEAWNVTGLLCGLSGDNTVNPTLVPANNIHLYFKVIEKYKLDYHTPNAPEDALIYKNSGNKSLLHFAANHCTFEEFKNIFKEFRQTYATEPQKIGVLLNATTTSNQIVACTTNHPDKEAINAFLDEVLDEYKANEYNEDAASTVDIEDQDELDELDEPNEPNEPNEPDELNDGSRFFFPPQPSDRRRRSREGSQEFDDAGNTMGR